jgi:riboflavin kinase/FMN adenylyltransferase
VKKKAVITIGTFDGVHRGHRFLINETLSSAKKNGLESIVIVLERPIKKVNGLLTTYEEKIEEISILGLNKIFVIKVSSKILSCTHDKFFDEFLCKTLNISEIVCGSDFVFGKNGKGDVKWLIEKVKNNNVTINVVKFLRSDLKQISSSYIRTLIEKDDVKNVANLLGRNYSFIGVPFREKGIGKKLGFPTINLQVSIDKLLPKGVYISLISQGNEIYPSITNIGTRITFDRGNEIIPETHILNFYGVWKNSQTKVAILQKIRNEKKFANSIELRVQILNDISVALQFFKEKVIE